MSTTIVLLVTNGRGWKNSFFGGIFVEEYRGQPKSKGPWDVP